MYICATSSINIYTHIYVPLFPVKNYEADIRIVIRMVVVVVIIVVILVAVIMVVAIRITRIT